MNNLIIARATGDWDVFSLRIQPLSIPLDSKLTSYDEDITLLCPSIRELNEMIVLCCEYAKQYDIMFNPKKTVYIKFESKINFDEHVSISGFPVQWSESMRHLGNLVDSTLSDSLDCRYKRSMFIGYVNKLISKFNHLQPHISINLFKTYCCPFFWI